MPTVVSESSAISHELLTSEEFLDWLEPGRHADLIDGEINMHSPVSLAHARLTNFLDFLLRSWLEKTAHGGELHREVVAVRLSPRTVVMPDLAWFNDEQVAQLAPTHAPIAPRWVAEVLSPRTSPNDTGRKFAAYEQHGVQEYWILDPATLTHQFYALEGEYFVEFASGAEWIESKVFPGFRVRRRWLDPLGLPQVAAALAEISPD